MTTEFEICQANKGKACHLIFNREKTDIVQHSPAEKTLFDTFQRIFYLETSKFY